MENITYLTEETYGPITTGSEAAVVDFYADWCGPCRMLRPTLEQISDERNDVIAAAVNIDENPELADMFGITSIPCVILFKNGAEADRSIGLVPKESLEALLG